MRASTIGSIGFCAHIRPDLTPSSCGRPTKRRSAFKTRNAVRSAFAYRTTPSHSALLEELGEPLMSSTLLLPGDPLPLTEPDDIRERLEKLVDAVIDGGACGVEPTSVIDFSRGEVAVLRRGKGDVSAFET